ncbi:MAG: AAA family ATPase [Lachnospiraceae bacterium]|nr:AAA family ATPase [Lachnospiraceae bacterium]
MDGLNLDWINYYKEMGVALLRYKNDRRELVDRLKKTYAKANIAMPILELYNELFDLDPFTVFGLFNRLGMPVETRMKIMSGLAVNIGVGAEIPSFFDSIPVLNDLDTTFYRFNDQRDMNDIDRLWTFFERAENYAQSPTAQNRQALGEYFDICLKVKGNGNIKITKGLYWMAPEVFMPIDYSIIWYLLKSGIIPAEEAAQFPEIVDDIPSTSYFEILDRVYSLINEGRVPFRNIPELVYQAWKASEGQNRLARVGDKYSKGTGLPDDDVNTIRYWMFAPGQFSERWDMFYKKGIMAIRWGATGDLRAYDSQEEVRQAMMAKIDPTKPFKFSSYSAWQFVNGIKPGDVIFVRKGDNEILGRGVVTSDYIFDDSPDDDYKHFRLVNWGQNGSWEIPLQSAVKVLADITPYTDYVDKLNSLFGFEKEGNEDGAMLNYPSYTKEDFLKDVYMQPEGYDRLVRLVKNKMNIIIEGAPGVGKTFTAKRLAYSMLGEKDPDRVEMIQFHQSYNYEDFIEGFRPSEKGMGFDIKRGAFYKFCRKAQEDPDNKYFFIIDEINRGNVSRIFGELFMLIEPDKRGNELQLLYSGEKFNVPRNIYIVGLMNTADRSIAMIDYALRRRFVFFDMKPGFESDGFIQYMRSFGAPKFESLINCVKELNQAITDDPALGAGFCVGHSYFSNLKSADDEILSNIVEYEMVPLLQEYWFDSPEMVAKWTENLRNSIA